jgi:hypothetical protein
MARNTSRELTKLLTRNLSRMRGNLHVRFLEGAGKVTSQSYSTP